MRTTMSTAMYVFHIILHPFDGFWELKHQKKNTGKASLILLALVCITMIMKLQLTNFTLNLVKPTDMNVLMEIISVVVPLAGWVVINWSISTLIDGKGNMKNIWVSSVYALFPLILLYIPQIIISHFVTFQEYSFYFFFGTVATLWCFVLMMIGNSIIQDYSIAKTVAVSFLTFLGALAVIFLGMVFFSTIQQLISFFVTLFFEIKYRG